jgi:DNA repair protein RecO (recombination protein O)
VKNKDIGILIGKKNYSESSLILTFYTELNGLSSFIFKGARKKKLAIFHLGIYELTFFKRAESELGIINALDVTFPLSDIYTNPQKTILCFFIADVLKQTLKVEGGDALVFNFIREKICLLEVQSDLYTFPLEFLTGLIANLGYLPHFEEDNAPYFDLQKGVFTAVESPYSYLVEEQTAQQLKTYFEGNYLQSFEKETTKKSLQLMIDYYRIHIPNFRIEVSLGIIKDTLYSSA